MCPPQLPMMTSDETLQLFVKRTTKPHNVVRGLVGDVRTVAVYRTPLACEIPLELSPPPQPSTTACPAAVPLEPPQRRSPPPSCGACPGRAGSAAARGGRRRGAVGGAPAGAAPQGRGHVLSAGWVMILSRLP